MGIESGVNHMPVCEKHRDVQNALNALHQLHPDWFLMGGDEQGGEQVFLLESTLEACPDCQVLSEEAFIRVLDEEGDSEYIDRTMEEIKGAFKTWGWRSLYPAQEARIKEDSLKEIDGIRTSLNSDRLGGGPIFPRKK